jgi:hypothetical protein
MWKAVIVSEILELLESSNPQWILFREVVSAKEKGFQNANFETLSYLSIIHYQLPQTPFHLIAQPTDLVIFTTTGFPANKLFTASSI